MSRLDKELEDRGDYYYKINYLNSEPNEGCVMDNNELLDRFEERERIMLKCFRDMDVDGESITRFEIQRKQDEFARCPHDFMVFYDVESLHRFLVAYKGRDLMPDPVLLKDVQNIRLLYDGAQQTLPPMQAVLRFRMDDIYCTWVDVMNNLMPYREFYKFLKQNRQDIYPDDWHVLKESLGSISSSSKVSRMEQFDDGSSYTVAVENQTKSVKGTIPKQFDITIPVLRGGIFKCLTIDVWIEHGEHGENASFMLMSRGIKDAFELACDDKWMELVDLVGDDALIIEGGMERYKMD